MVYAVIMMAPWTNYITLVTCVSFVVCTGFSLPQIFYDSSSVTTNDQNLTSDVPRLITRSDGRIAAIIAPESMKLVSKRKMELDYYDSLWRQANVTKSTNTESKIDVLGTLLKKHVHKLRSVPNGKVELVFLVDSSASVGMENFFNELKFVKKLLADFTVAQWATRVAIITFSSRHRVHAVVDQLRNPSSDNHKCSLLNEELPTITYVGGGTYTKGAFLEAQAVLEYARPNASKVVFLITDGYSNGGDPRDIAEALREDGVEIFTFGIKNGNVQELLDMSSALLIEHCYILTSFEEFESLARRALHEDLEEGEYITEAPTKCRSLCRYGDYCCHHSAVCRCGIHTGQYECVCPPGHYGTGIENDCKPCPMETYKPTSSPGGISTCLPCPDQYQKSPPGSSNVSHCYCAEGFRSVNKNRRCEKIRCPRLSQPSHGEFFGGSCDNSVNSACAITCEQGYESVGALIRLCTESGEWTGDEFQCVVKTCDPFPDPENGFTNCTNDQYVTGTVCTSQCDEGYNLVGTRDRKCLHIAMWDGLRASCRIATCRPMDPIPHGRIVPSNCTKRSVPFRTGCRVRCRKGYTRIGSMRTTCGSDGEWQIQGTMRAECVDLTPPTIECDEDKVVNVLPSKNYRNVSWEIPTVRDSTGHRPSLKVSPSVSPPWKFEIGDTVITYTATDRAGLQKRCSFTITVVDNEQPQVEECPSHQRNCPSDIREAQEVEWQLPVFSDNSGHISNITVIRRSPSVMPFGATVVEYTAADDYGNVNTCIIEHLPCQTVCEPPRRPAFGETTCISLDDGSLNCTLTCNEGYSFPEGTHSCFTCNPDGSWFPSAVPNIDCQATYTPTQATQRMRLIYKEHNCSVDLVRRFENHLSTTLYEKINDYCGETMTCDVTTMSSLCRDDGTLQNYLNERLSTQPHHSNILHDTRRYQEVRGTELSSHVFNALQGPAVEVNAIINATAFRTSNSTTPQDALGALLSILQSIPGRLEEDAKRNLSRMGLNGSLFFVLPEGTDPRCNDGSVTLGKECVPCSPGMYHDKKLRLCIRCPRGTYQSQPGMASCDRCPDGTSTNEPGRESISDCKLLCKPGAYSLTGVEQCVSCPVGTYQPSSGSVSCIHCERNTTTVHAGSTIGEECSAPCRPGHVSSSGLEPCLPCPRGSFQPLSKRQECHECPSNGMTQNTGATSILNCYTAANGWTRSLSESNMTDIPFSACFSSPCQNNASCEDVLLGFSCTCQPGYTGLLCESDIDECESSPCVNGTCKDLLNDFQCLCADGFTGRLCDKNVNDCSSSVCFHDGICHDEVADFTCECPSGYEGKRCEIEVDECLSNPCPSGSSCVDQYDGFYCSCPSNATGGDCSVNVEECFDEASFHHEACNNFFRNASCETMEENYAAALCKGRIDHCSSDPCQNDGTCVNTVAGFICLCKSGLTGAFCSDVLPWDFSLKWKRQGTIDYSILKGSETFEDLHEVTVAFWMQTSDTTTYGTPFSYASDNSIDNALTLTDYTGFVINVNKFNDENTVVTDVTANDGLWHHIALTWKSEGGLWSLYKDGVSEINGSHLSEGIPIQGGGVFILGQEQDHLGGGFHTLESFIGEIALLNLWPRMMSDDEIYNLSQSCGNPEHAIIRWPAFLSGKTGDVRKGNINFCEGCQRPLAPAFGSVTNYIPGVPLLEVKYACNHGFLVYGNGRTRCQVSGEWLPPDPPECRRVLCNHPGDLDHGNIEGYTYLYEDVIRYECWSNYVIVGPSTRTCQANGLWTGPTPVCIRSNCGRLPSIENGEATFEPGTTPEGTVTYSCRSGYQLIGNATVSCEDSGYWGSLPFCQPISCQEPRDEIQVKLLFTNGTNAGDVREYGCEEGYILEGAYFIICGDNGTWSQSIPSCRPVPCDAFPLIDNMIHSPEIVSYGDMIYVRCVEGYHLNGNVSLSCSSDGTWKHPLPSCTPVSCGQPPVVANAQSFYGNFSFKENVTIKCEDGYNLHGEETLSCGPIGSWYPQPPTCEPVSCGEPPKVQNATSIITGIFYKHFVFYSCNEGYNAAGAASFVCSSNGTWVPHEEITEDSFNTDIEKTMCEPISCGVPPLVENSNEKEMKNITYGEEHIYECWEGYQLEGSKVISCQSDGTWLPHPPRCQPVLCGPLQTLPNLIVQGTEFTFGQNVTFYCPQGFVLSGTPVTHCLADGTWSSPPPSCDRLSCGEPPVIEQGLAKATGTLFGDFANYSCVPGYYLFGTNPLTCSELGYWSPSPPSCFPISCGEVPLVENTMEVFGSYNFGESVSYQCKYGYEASTDITLTCGTLGQWEGIAPVCTPLSCGDPPTIANGRIIGDTYTYDSSVTYDCLPGYYTIVNSFLRCDVDQTWKGRVSECHPVNCGQPEQINHGRVVFNLTTYRQRVHYECSEGYDLIGKNVHRCLATGMWSSPPPVCRPVYCGQPPSLENGTLIGENFHFNQTITFRCNVGYWLYGNNKSVCTASRQWSNPSPLCVRIECPELASPANGYIEQSSAFLGTTVRYVCLPGYILHGADTRTCREDGSWDGTEGSCVPVDCGTPPELANATLTLTGQTLHHKAEYLCLEGFHQKMDVSLTCHQDGSWTSIPIEVVCEPVMCLLPPSIQHGDYLGTNLEYNSTVTYKCDPGHNLVGPASLVCSESGWISSDVTSNDTLPSCQIVSCGHPPSLPNGYSSANGSNYGETAQLFCMRGYDLRGLDFITCLANGQWDELSASCQPITCTPPITEDHGTIQPQTKIYEFMEKVTYGCHEGYELRGEKTTSCVGINSWNGTTPFCDIVSCGDPPQLSMGSVEYNTTVFGSEVFYSCYAGFLMNGTSYLQCLADGQWSKPAPVCHAVPCGPPPDVLHGYHTQGNFFANDTIRYRCQPGYSLAGSDIRTCSTNGEWTGPVPRCYPTQCPTLENPTNGYVHHDGTTYLATASYTCDTGFVLHGEAGTICQASGEWTNRKPSCLPITCSEPPSFPSAFIQETMFSSLSSYEYQDTVTYQCEPGFTLASENTITCSAYGTWEPPIVICQPVECLSPMLTYGLSYISDAMTYKSELVFSCLDGYTMNGAPFATCTESGEWSHPPPLCEKIRCPQIATPLNGKVSTVGTHYQDTAKFLCNAGYHLHGEVEINCTINGTWSAPAPKCKPMLCQKPPDIEYGIPLIDKLYSSEDIIFYKCRSGYSLEGKMRRRCQRDGTWTGKEPSCKRSQASSAVVKAPPGCVLPCLHGGQCIGHYQCDCRYGFTGSRCETVLCMPRCFNGAKCVGRHPECSACNTNGSC